MNFMEPKGMINDLSFLSYCEYRNSVKHTGRQIDTHTKNENIYELLK